MYSYCGLTYAQALVWDVFLDLCFLISLKSFNQFDIDKVRLLNVYLVALRFLKSGLSLDC